MATRNIGKTFISRACSNAEFSFIEQQYATLAEYLAPINTSLPWINGDYGATQSVSFLHLILNCPAMQPE